MAKRCFAMMLAVLILFTQIAGGQTTFFATEVSTETPQGEAETPVDTKTQEFEAREEYYFPYREVEHALINWDWGVSNRMEYFICNDEYPEGRTGETTILNVTAENGSNDLDAEGDVVTITPNDSGYNIHMNRCGHAVITYTYLKADGVTEATHTTEIYVGMDVYRLDIFEYNTRVNCILPGTSMGLQANVVWERVSEDGYYYQGNTADAIYEWSLSCSADVATVSATNEFAIVNVSDDLALCGQSFNVCVTVSLPQDGTYVEVVSQQYDVHITDGYYYSMPAYCPNEYLGIGSTVLVEPSLHYAYYDREIGAATGYQVDEDWRIRWEFNTTDISIMDIDGNEIVPYSAIELTSTMGYNITKLRNQFAEVKICFDVKDENGEYVEVAQHTWPFQGLDYNIWFENLIDGDHMTVYVGNQQVSMNLNTGNIYGRDVELEWQVGICDETGEFTYTIPMQDDTYYFDEASSLLILNTEGIWRELLPAWNDENPENMHCSIRAIVKSNGQEVSRADAWVELCQERIEYYFQIGSDSVLPNWGQQIYTSLEYHIWNGTYPGGMNAWTDIIDVTVANAADEMGTDPVLSVVYQDWGCWNINAIRPGHAQITITYRTHEGSIAQYVVDKWVTTEVFHEESWSSMGSSDLVPGHRTHFYVNIRRECFDEENGCYDASMDGYTYQWSCVNLEDAEYITLTQEEGIPTNIAIDVAQKDGILDRYCPLQLAIIDPEGTTVYTHEYGFWIRYSSVVLQPVILDTYRPAVGDTMVIVPQVYHYECGKEVENITERMEYEWRFGEDSLSITDADGKKLGYGERSERAPFTLTKISNVNSTFQLVVFDKFEGYEITQREWSFAEINYYTNFENLREEFSTYIFPGEEYEIRVNTAPFKGTNYEIRWRLQFPNGEIVPESPETYMVSEDTDMITIHTDGIYALLSSYEEPMGSMVVNAEIYVGENMVSNIGTTVDIRDVWCQYQFSISEQEHLLPGHTREIQKNMSYRLVDGAHPYGFDGETTVVSVDVRNASYNMDPNPVLEVEDKGYAWEVRANRIGDAVVTITYLNYKGEEESKEMYFYSSDVVTEFHIDSNLKSNRVLPGEEISLDVTFMIHCFNQDTKEYYDRDVSGYRFEWRLTDSMYDGYVTLTPDPENDTHATVQIADSTEFMNQEIRIAVSAFLPEEEGGWYFREEYFGLEICQDTYRLSPISLETENLLVGESIEVTPDLYFYQYGNAPVLVDSNVEFVLEYNTNAILVTDSNGNEIAPNEHFYSDTITIKKLKNWNTGIHFIAMVTGSEGDTHEVTRTYWTLHECDFSFALNNLRENYYTWLYTNEEGGEDYTISIDDSKFADAPYTVEWVVGVKSDEEFVYTVDANTGAYTISEDGKSITMNGNGMWEAIANFKNPGEEINMLLFDIAAYIIVNGEVVNDICIGADVREEFCVYLAYAGDVCIIPGKEFTYPKDIQVYIENPECPYGKYEVIETVASISNAEDEPGDTPVLQMTPLADGSGWNFVATRLGHGVITRTFTRLDGQEDAIVVNVYAVDDYYEVELRDDRGCNQILPGFSIGVNAGVMHYEYGEDGSTSSNPVGNEVEYRWYLPDENLYDYVSLEVDEKYPNSVNVATNNQIMEYTSNVTLCVDIIKDGEVITTGYYDIEICEVYYQLHWNIPVLTYGQRARLECQLIRISMDAPWGESVNDVTYRITSDSEWLTLNEEGLDIYVNEDPENRAPMGHDVMVRVYADGVDSYGDAVHVEKELVLYLCKHEWVHNKVEATCTEDGYIEHNCNNCGTYVKEDIPAAGHTEVKDKAVAATCTKSGKTEGSHCSKCGTTIVAQKKVDALGHKKVTDKAVAATCTKSGKTEGSHCSRCDKILVEQKKVDALGHDYKTVITKATTSKDGKSEKICDRCDKLSSTTVIKKISSIKLSTESYTYSGSTKTPNITVKDSAGKTLVKDTDYTVSYASGRKDPGRYSVKVTFKGKYSGSKTLYFTIEPKAVEIEKIRADKKGFTVYWDKASKGTGYQIYYSTSSGFSSSTTKSVTVEGITKENKGITNLLSTKKYYVKVRVFQQITVDGSSTKIYSDWSDVMTVITKDSNAKLSSIASVKLSTTEYIYDGKEKIPSVTVKDKAGNTLTKNTDYKVTYASGRKNPGSYKVTISYIGNYKGIASKALYFTIAPKKVSISKLTAASKGFKVTYTKGSGVTGYEIQYSTSSKFTSSSTKTVTVSSSSTVSKSISKLTGGKNYYVRVRAYKTATVNGKSKKIYSDWSAVKNVTTKK